MGYIPIPFSSANGNFFNQIGKIGALLKNCQSYQATQLTSFTNLTTGAIVQYNAMPDLQALLGNAYISQLNSPGSNIGALIQNQAQQTFNRVVFLSNPRISQTQQNLNITAAITEVIRQMKVAGATILAMTVTVTPSTGSNGGSFLGTGNGVITASAKRPLDGLVLENSFSELIQVLCTSDSYTGGATAGNETFTVTGTGNQTNFFAYNWPLGSNAQNSVSAIDGDKSNASGNLLTNSGWATASSTNTNSPANWTVVVGTPGTNIFLNSGVIYTTGNSLQFLGDGSTLQQVTQQFNNSTSGTSGTLSSITQYSFNAYMRRDGTTVSSGVLVVDLIDQNGNIIQDQNGVNNSVSFNLNTLTTSWQSYTGIFRTPEVLPTSQFIRYRLTTAINSGASAYIDKTSFGTMTQLYTSGPFVAVHAGSIPFVDNDLGTVNVVNSRGSGGTLATFQTLLCQLLPTQVLGQEFLFPSAPSGSNTISDSLIA